MIDWLFFSGVPLKNPSKQPRAVSDVSHFSGHVPQDDADSVPQDDADSILVKFNKCS